MIDKSSEEVIVEGNSFDIYCNGDLGVFWD
jgi:hypothetical protein